MAQVTESAASSKLLQRLRELGDWPNANRTSPAALALSAEVLNEREGAKLPGVVGALREEDECRCGDDDRGGDLVLPEHREQFGMERGDAGRF